MNDSFLQNKKLLVVEDNTINQMLVKHTLQKTGALIDIADDGLVAVEMVKNNAYDLILMDLQLPEMDGYEVTKFIRKELKNDVIIIAMSAMMFLGEEQKCEEAGMNGYLLKPFTIEVFFEKIGAAFNEEAKAEANIYQIDELTIDTNILYSLGGTDNNYLKLVVQTFVDNMGEVIAKMDRACADKNYDDLMKTAHYAKSSLSVVKIDPMYEIMQQIEVQCKNKAELDSLQGKIQWLKEVYPKADKGLRKIFDIQTLAAAPTA